MCVCARAHAHVHACTGVHVDDMIRKGSRRGSFCVPNPEGHTQSSWGLLQVSNFQRYLDTKIPFKSEGVVALGGAF